jgi:hypothetical protein
MPIAGACRGESQVSKLKMEQRLPLLAIVKGLRDGGEVSDATISAIAASLRAATKISDEMGHSETSAGLSHLAECIEAGRVE